MDDQDLTLQPTETNSNESASVRFIISRSIEQFIESATYEESDQMAAYLMQTDEKGMYLTNIEIASQLLSPDSEFAKFYSNFNLEFNPNHNQDFRANLTNSKSLISLLRGRLVHQNLVQERESQIQANSKKIKTILDPRNTNYEEVLSRILELLHNGDTYPQIAQTLNEEFASSEELEVKQTTVETWVAKNRGIYNIPLRRVVSRFSNPDNVLGEEIYEEFCRRFYDLYGKREDGTYLQLKEIADKLNEEFGEHGIEATKDSLVHWSTAYRKEEVRTVVGIEFEIDPNRQIYFAQLSGQNNIKYSEDDIKDLDALFINPTETSARKIILNYLREKGVAEDQLKKEYTRIAGVLKRYNAENYKKFISQSEQ